MGASGLLREIYTRFGRSGWPVKLTVLVICVLVGSTSIWFLQKRIAEKRTLASQICLTEALNERVELLISRPGESNNTDKLWLSEVRVCFDRYGPYSKEIMDLYKGEFERIENRSSRATTAQRPVETNPSLIGATESQSERYDNMSSEGQRYVDEKMAAYDEMCARSSEC